jgi:hypothetical protein
MLFVLYCTWWYPTKVCYVLYMLRLIFAYIIISFVCFFLFIYMIFQFKYFAPWSVLSIYLVWILVLTASVVQWSSGHSSWLQIQRSGFNSRRCQIFWEVVSLERCALSLVSTTEELLERKSSCSGLESREYGRKDSSLWSRGTFYPQKLTLTSPTSGGLSFGIVRSRSQAMEFSLVYFISPSWNPAFGSSSIIPSSARFRDICFTIIVLVNLRIPHLPWELREQDDNEMKS